MDVRTFTVGPVQENCHIARLDGAARGDRDRPRRRGAAAARGDRRARASRSRRSCSPTRTSTTSARSRRSRARPARRSGAPSSRSRCSPTSCATSRGPASARSSPTTPTTPSPAARRLELAGLEIDVLFTPGHSPGHVTYSIPAEQAIFSGDVLFAGLDRPHRPARRRPRDADAHARRRWSRRCPDETVVYPGHMGNTTIGRERADQPVPGRARVSGRIQAPRGTFDVLGEDALAREALEGHARADPRARRLRADRDADVRGDRAVRARRRRVDRRRPEGDVHVRRRARRDASRCAPRAPRRSAAPTSSTACTSCRSR